MLAVVSVVISFAIYASTVLTLPQLRISSACCEWPGVAAAVSNIVYEAPLGSHYSGVWDYFERHGHEPLSRTLEAADTISDVPMDDPGFLRMTNRDGNGVGYPLVATASFRLFGMHTWALQITMMLLMALSAAALLWRFRSPGVVWIATLYFGALELMLFMPQVWQPIVLSQLWVGGLRYFSVVSVLPIIHILLTLLDGQPAPSGRWRDLLPLALQTMILLLTMMVRGSALPLFGAIGAVVMALAWKQRRNPKRLAELVVRFATIGLVGAGSLAAIAFSVPREYFTEGRIAPAVWERVLQSVGVHPGWPFPGAAEMFDCKQQIPTGIQSGTGDDFGHCVWFDYAAKHSIPLETAIDEILGDRYEVAMREAFFKIAKHYPGEVLVTFLYYKPLRIWGVVRKSMRFNFAGDQSLALRPGEALIPYPPLAKGLLLSMLAVMIVLLTTVAVPLTELWQLSRVTLIATLFTLPSYFAAWSNLHTSADFVLYVLLILGLATGAMIIPLRPALVWLAWLTSPQSWRVTRLRFSP